METIALQIFLAAVAIASVISLLAASVTNTRIKELEKLVWELRKESKIGAVKTSSMADEFNNWDKEASPLDMQ